ncbi:MAG: hypothetical protein OXL96_24345 [Candidatus Poribacteria bacterium]|nr:hypothetical protein [Candidatus Poribacteria bacterium]
MGLLSIFSLVWGVLAILGMAVGIIPCFGSLNYLNIPFAVFGLFFSIVVIVLSSKKELAVAGSLLCAVAIFIGAIRLVIGFGVF